MAATRMTPRLRVILVVGGVLIGTPPTTMLSPQRRHNSRHWVTASAEVTRCASTAGRSSWYGLSVRGSRTSPWRSIARATAAWTGTTSCDGSSSPKNA